MVDSYVIALTVSCVLENSKMFGDKILVNRNLSTKFVRINFSRYNVLLYIYGTCKPETSLAPAVGIPATCCGVSLVPTY